MIERLDIHGTRYYRKLGSNQFKISITELSNKILPTSPFLIKWLREKGEASTAYVEYRAKMGTVLHKLVSDLLCRKTVNYELIKEYMNEEKLDSSIISDSDTLYKGALSFVQFMQDYEVELINSETMVASEKLHVAGTYDALVFMKFNKKRVISLLDAKIGGIWTSHEFQLSGYQYMIEEAGGVVYMKFNWSPKDFTLGKTPSYELKNQTKSKYTPEMFEKLYLNGLALGMFHIPSNYEVLNRGLEIESTMSLQNLTIKLL